jgi:hypothetical protein
MVRRRRHGDLHGSGRPRGGGNQRDEEVLRHGGDGLPPQALRARAVRSRSDAGAVSGLPQEPPEGSDGAVPERAAPLQHRFRGVVLPEIQRVPGLRWPGDAAACRAAGPATISHTHAPFFRSETCPPLMLSSSKQNIFFSHHGNSQVLSKFIKSCSPELLIRLYFARISATRSTTLTSSQCCRFNVWCMQGGKRVQLESLQASPVSLF